MTDSIIVDDLRFQLRRSSRRTTVGITIDRDGSLILSAPVECPIEQITQIAREKQLWIYRKLMEREQLALEGSKREFVSGEGFWYLGRSYRLHLVEPRGADDLAPALRLYRGRFTLRRDQIPNARNHFIRWYANHGRSRIESSVELLAPRIGVHPESVSVRELKHRWGSCTPRGRLHFHWRVALLPQPMVDYLVAHELVHLHEPNHAGEFWRRLERVIPDYAERKAWLAENGARYDL
ncbi:MAG TPA: SprT family zinc-dependent metalloprotease [Chloroflexota bacterium]|nr:SprT family zinc-dependent metalloprotease [Chloroflexota bacterium]